MSDSAGRQPTYADVNRDVIRTLEPPSPAYFGWMTVVALILTAGILAWTWQIYAGMGAAGKRTPQMWAMYITTFVFWIGIGHAGTLISAILYLFRARWRTSIYRGAEAMTVFAVLTAGLFPLIHAGRMWFAYWLLPYPNQRYLWPNFRSPLVWDVFAISTYLTISVVFFSVGLLPDIAAIRDASTGWRKKIYGVLSLGWEGTDRQWRHYRRAYGLFAALATPLVLSVHSVVSWDFAMALTPGWHSTIFAPYFVAGAIFSGVAMMLTLLILVRKMLRLEAYIPVAHFENLAKLVIPLSLILTYVYATEFFISRYSGSPFERATLVDRATGVYAPFFWIMVTCNSVVPLLLFFKRVRTDLRMLFVISILMNIGMWIERFVLIVSSLAHSFDPAEWSGMYHPTWVEVAITAGSFAWFFLLFLLFVKNFPVVSMAELKEETTREGMHVA